MRARKKPTFFIPRSVAVFAPRHIRAPLISTPIKFLSGLRSARATVYSPFPQPNSRIIGLSFLKNSLCQLPFSGCSVRNISSNCGSTKQAKVLFSANLLSLSFPILFNSYSDRLYALNGTARSYCKYITTLLVEQCTCSVWQKL